MTPANPPPPPSQRAGYEQGRDGPLPCILWAYPREYKSKDAAGAYGTYTLHSLYGIHTVHTHTHSARGLPPPPSNKPTLNTAAASLPPPVHPLPLTPST